jgi:hypothetical protein
MEHIKLASQVNHLAICYYWLVRLFLFCIDSATLMAAEEYQNE